MPDQEFILDYASPRPRGRLRLPARSVIRWTIDPDTHGATITATLAGKENAIGGLIFGFFTFVVISCCAAVEIDSLQRYPNGWPFAAVCTVVALTEFVLMVLIIDQTWAKTTLRATRESLLFRTRSPFRRQELSWHAQEVLAVRLENTQDQPGAAPLAQIRIETDRPPSLTLFVDHLLRDLVPVNAAIHFGLGLTDTPPVREQTIAPHMPQAEPDERTFSRLMDVHRQVRSRTANRRD